MRTLLTISDFGCCGTVVGQHGAPGQQRPPLDGAGAGGGLGQPALPLAHLRAGGVPVGIGLQLRAAGEGEMEETFQGTFKQQRGCFRGRAVGQPELILPLSPTVITFCRCSPAELCPFPPDPGFAPTAPRPAAGIKVLLRGTGVKPLPAPSACRAGQQGEVKESPQYFQCWDWLANNAEESELCTFHLLPADF